MGDYTPSTPNGTWTSMCSISAQARAIAYAADNANYQMAEGVWVGSWPTLPEYGAPDLNKPDFSTNLYFEANAVWFGDNEGAADKEFLDTYYQTGLTETAAGTADQVARGHILKTTSQDWLSVTYIMKGLGDAAAGLAAGGDNGTAAAQNAYDEIAATFLGCGNLNPVALPTFPTGITWGDTYATKGPTYYTVAGTMQEISSSYGTQNSTSKASSLAEGVVADLVAGPSSETVDSIEGAILTVYAQSTLRYAANMTLDAHLPGNGMGGSTKPVELTEPTIESGVTACGVNQLTLTEADCADLEDFDTNSTCEDTLSAYALAGSPDGPLDFDFPLCCNIASNAPGDIARTVPTEWDGDSYIPPAGTGWVDVSWLRAGIDRYAEDAEVDDPATNSSALANTYLANTGVTYAGLSTSATGAADAKQWGGLTVLDDGTITQPASGCTNSRANAMGVGNSFSAWAQQTSESFLDGNTTTIADDMFLMDSLDTRLVPYYIGQFGDVDAAQDLACWKLQASGIEADVVADAETAAVGLRQQDCPLSALTRAAPACPPLPPTTARTAATRRQGATLLASPATRTASTPASPRWWVVRPSSTSSQLSSRTRMPRPTSRPTRTSTAPGTSTPCSKSTRGPSSRTSTVQLTSPRLRPPRLRATCQAPSPSPRGMSPSGPTPSAWARRVSSYPTASATPMPA